jgi:uncharacterized protein YbjT (DUF2867 family)
MSYVVTGATGQVGSAVVDYLLAQSVPVRVVIRSENKAESFRSRHVDVAIADLTDADALTKAFQGAKAVFAMNPPAYNDPDLQVAAVNVSRALASAIKAAKVERVVVLSSVGGERSSKTGNILTAYTMEEALKTSAPQVVMVRAASFTENWLHAISAVKSGQSPVIGSMYRKLDRKIPHIATNDIGRVSAEYMIKPTTEVKDLIIIELEGPEPYSPNDVAKVTSEALGKSVPAMAMTEEMARGLIEKFGWSKTNGDNWVEMFKGFDDGTICWTNDPKVIRVQGKVALAEVLNKVLH